MPSMNSFRTQARRRGAMLTALALSASLGVIAGCESGPEDDKDKIMMPPEVGVNVREWQARQIAKADAAFFIIYRHEWQNSEDVAVLSEFGFSHARRVAERAMVFDYPIIIEPEPGQPELDQRRVEHMVEFLSDRNVPLARRRVIVAVPREIPRDADEFPIPSGNGGAGASK